MLVHLCFPDAPYNPDSPETHLMKLPTRQTVCALTIAAAGLILTGCHGSTKYHAYRGNPTPELQTLSERPIDVDRHLVVTQDHNLRMFSEDVGRALYLDHPSRLTPYPIVYTSGVPR